MDIGASLDKRSPQAVPELNRVYKNLICTFSLKNLIKSIPSILPFPLFKRNKDKGPSILTDKQKTKIIIS